ncbi:MAG TPA: amidase family protein [Streptosporangiaceae bacterium]|jgi:amidase
MYQRPSRDQLAALSDRLGLGLSDAELGSYATMADIMLAGLDPTDLDPPPAPDPATRRSAGRRPAPGEDPLNAVVRWCDVAGAPGGALAGLRIAVKDSVPVGGVPMTAASRVLRGYTPAEDAIVTERLLGAGARVVAITNMDEFALSGGGDTGCYGPTLTPYDTGRTAGGSSGGSGAILAYPGVDAAIGTDQGGSVRVPAAWCGVLGLKPTYGLVPYTGALGLDATIDHAGPMARDAATLARVLAAIAGPDPREGRYRREVRVADYADAVASGAGASSLDGLRLGVVRQGFGAEVGAQDEVVAACRAAVERLRDAGAEIVDVDLPEHARPGAGGFAVTFEGFLANMESGGNGSQREGRYPTGLARALGPALARHGSELGASVKSHLLLGAYLRERYNGVAYAGASHLRGLQRAAYDAALADVDLLVMPTTPNLPHEVDPDLDPVTRALRGWANLTNTSPINGTGHPALSLPLADHDGLPVGVMAVAPYFADDRLLAFAATCENLLGWRPALPSFPAPAGPPELT